MFAAKKSPKREMPVPRVLRVRWPKAALRTIVSDTSPSWALAVIGLAMRSGASLPDQARLLEIAGSLYEAAIDPTLMPAALEDLMVASGSVGGCIQEPYGNAFNPRRITTPGLSDYFADMIGREYWRIEPRVRLITESKGRPGGAWARLSRGGLLTDLDLITAEECDRHPYYQEFLRAHDLRYGAYFWLAIGGRKLVFAASRAASAGAFQPHELGLLATLRGHLERALRISSELAAARSISHSLLGMVSSLGMAALLIEADGAIAFANAAACRLDGHGISLRRRRFRASNPPDQAALDRLLKAVLGATLHSADLNPVALQRPDRRPLLVQAMPVSMAQAEANELTLAPPAALVLIADPDEHIAADPQRSLRLLGLTAAEARIAWWAGQGLSAAEVGAKVGNAEGTVRFSLKRVYQKLGIGRQSELALLVARVTAFTATMRPPESGS